MKKILSILLAAVFLISLFAVPGVASTGECYETYGDNVGAHEYTWFWATTTESYLVELNNGKLMRVQYDYYNNCILVEYYTADCEFISYKTLLCELPIFGGFYASDDYYFVLTGQENPNELKSVECFRITKYDKNWNKITSVGMYDCNTTVPFDAGCVRFAECGDFLLIRTSHEMYTTSDGLNHQANVTIELNMKTMQITDSLTEISNSNYGYISHSFNQFIKVENNRIVALDHGDALPRSIVLTKYNNDVSDGTFFGSCQITDMLSIYGATGTNKTGCTVGGFEISESAYIAVGTSVDQSKGNLDAVQNVYVSSLSKSDLQVTLTYITDYDDVSASVPFLVKISETQFLLMWEKSGTVYYTMLDKYGNVTGKIYEMNALLSDCDPIVYNGKVIWYVWSENTVDFYEISLSALSDTKKISVNNTHRYNISATSGDTVTLSCEKCSKKISGTLPIEVYLLEAQLFEDGYSASGVFADSFHKGDSIVFLTRAFGGNFTDVQISASEPSVARIEKIMHLGTVFYKVSFIENGTTDIIVSSVYNPDIKTVYPITVKHRYGINATSVQQPTCTKEGSQIVSCVECGAQKTEAIPATGHSYKTEVVDSSATSQGYTLYTCADCGYTYRSDFTNSPTADVRYGDCNYDGLINAADARIALRLAVKLEQETPELVEVADVTHDGVVKSDDARSILRVAVKIENEQDWY